MRIGEQLCWPSRAHRCDSASPGSSKNWSSALLRGKLHFKHLEFNEVVMAQLLELPPHVRLASMTLTDLRITLSWTKLGCARAQHPRLWSPLTLAERSEPVAVDIGRIAIELEQCAEVRRPPRIVQIDPKLGEYKRTFATNVVENANVSLGELHVVYRARNAEPVTATVRDIGVRVADSQFGTRVHLPDLINANKGQPEVLLYRAINVDRVTLRVGQHTVLDRTSLDLKLCVTIDASDGHVAGGSGKLYAIHVHCGFADSFLSNSGNLH